MIQILCLFLFGYCAFSSLLSGSLLSLFSYIIPLVIILLLSSSLFLVILRTYFLLFLAPTYFLSLFYKLCHCYCLFQKKQEMFFCFLIFFFLKKKLSKFPPRLILYSFGFFSVPMHSIHEIRTVLSMLVCILVFLSMILNTFSCQYIKI